MAYVVDRVVICDAFREPDRHYQLLAEYPSKKVGSSRKQEKATETVLEQAEVHSHRTKPRQARANASS